MDAKEKKKFIKGLCNAVRDDVVKSVCDMPEYWDGHEIQQLLADRFEREVMVKMSPKRRRNFRNEVIVRNL